MLNRPEMPHLDILRSHLSLAYLQSPRALTEQRTDRYNANATAEYLESLSQTLLHILINDQDISSPLLEKHLSHPPSIPTKPTRRHSEVENSI